MTVTTRASGSIQYIRRDIYAKSQNMSFEDLQKFFDANIKNNHYNILVLGDRTKVDRKWLEKFGEVKELELKDVFGY